MRMMELFLSSDGKHTVHVAAETPDKLIRLLPQAKLVYEAVVRAYGGKGQVERPANGNGHGEAERKAPLCPEHSSALGTRRPWRTVKLATRAGRLRGDGVLTPLVVPDEDRGRRLVSVHVRCERAVGHGESGAPRRVARRQRGKGQAMCLALFCAALEQGAGPQAGVVGDKLEELARQGGQAMLAAALEQEGDEFLQRARYARGRKFRGYRNGHAPERTVGVGVGAVRVRLPRVSDVPCEVAPHGFASQIVGRYQRASEATQRLLARLYLEGLSTGDSEPVFRVLLGETAPLSPSSIVRLKAQWQEECESWRRRRLDG
ncbi:MAG: hypothetical protein FJZ90_18575, partial [Chloroflexi bacterium]|nr:hypothetical protein [Chloroflexota bacterium]